MECKLKEILRLFMQSQSKLNELFNEDIESIKEELESIKEELTEQSNVNNVLHYELSKQDNIKDWLTKISNRLYTITESMNDIESRLNKLEKEIRRNASNK